MGTGVVFGYDAIVETAFPQWVEIGNNVQIGVRTTILAHIHAFPPSPEELAQDYISVKIGNDVNIGPGSIILPRVTIGDGSVVAAGSVVTTSVAPLTMVQGNPARPIARCGVPLTWDTPLKEFFKNLKPLRTGPAGAARKSPDRSTTTEGD